MITMVNIYDQYTAGQDAYKAKFDGTNLVEFTIAKVNIVSGSEYLVIGADVIDDTSIITINEPIE